MQSIKLDINLYSLLTMKPVFHNNLLNHRLNPVYCFAKQFMKPVNHMKKQMKNG